MRSFVVRTCVEYPTTCPWGDPGSTVLATTNGQPAVVVGDMVSGRGVYLGPIYSSGNTSWNPGVLRNGNADRLLEQAVYWAANVAAASTPTSLNLTAPNASYDGIQHGGSAVVSPPGATGTITYVYTGTGGYNSSVPPTNAGTYQVAATFTPDSAAYEASTATATFTIAQRSISFAIGNAAHDYGSTVDFST